MILTLVKEHTLIVLSAISLLVFLCGKMLQTKNKKGLVTFTISLLVVLFSLRNYPYLQELINESSLSFINAPILSVQKLGLSYILFRFIHWIIESSRGKIKSSDFVTFINYILFFPTLLAGPIDSYKNFHYWTQNKRLGYRKSLFFAGITRIFIGAFKTLGLVPFIIEYAKDYSLFMPEYSAAIALTMSLFLYSLYIYLDFSGYCDIAIGTAYLIGIKTPENFNNPYLSTSLSEFWKRWHITFSTFLKDYIFKPTIKLYNKLINPKYRLTVSVLCYLTTFLICGLWHGDKINFVYWGLWHGIGLALNKIWAVKFKILIQKLPHRIYQLSSGVLTFSFVTAGWMFFHYSESELITIFSLL
jgi:alginate O-acetyltransferase complex protein AlgI